MGLSSGISTPAIRGMLAPELPVVSCQLPVEDAAAAVFWQLATHNWQVFLTLLLLVLRIAANHAHDAFAADDLAVFTNSTDAGSYLHDCTFARCCLKNCRIGLYSRKKYYFQFGHAVRCRGRPKFEDVVTG